MGKKIVVSCLEVIMIAFFPRNIQLSSIFAQKARRNTERVLPGHPIILLKSNKFNMATVSVKRSIHLNFLASRKLYFSSKRKGDSMWQTLRLQSHLKAKKYIIWKSHTFTTPTSKLWKGHFAGKNSLPPVDFTERIPTRWKILILSLVK